VTATTMTRDEREGLQRLVRQRERVLKSAAKQRSRELIADFENQMGQEYAFDQDEVWEQAIKAADAVVAKAQAQVHARCRELKIADRFAPSLSVDWHRRGYGNALESRRKELRRMAETRVEAIEQKSHRADRAVLPQGARAACARRPHLGRGEAVYRAAVRCAVTSIAMSLK
jgi:vacuolar-type H+-ATPase subunit H